MSRTHSSRRARLRLEPLDCRLNPVNIRYNFSLDTGNLFQNQAAKDALQRATDAILPKLQDNLAAIVPSGGNQLNVTFYNPVSNGMLSGPVQNIPENELVVYVTSGDIGDSELGYACSAGWSANGSQDFLNLVRSRGQSGALTSPSTDIAPLGGLLAFNSLANWNFGSGNPASDQFDFESVAHHELLHMLGFGLGDEAFERNTSNGEFVGPSVVAIRGATRMDSINQHFNQETFTETGRSVMAPILILGEKHLTGPVEFAALQDIGWEVGDPQPIVPPSPPPSNENVGTTVPIGQPDPGGNVTLEQFPRISKLVDELKSGSQVNSAFIVSGLRGGFQVYQGSKTGLAVPTGPIMRPFPGFNGTIRTATGDVNGDGVPDLISATGPGGGSQIRVMDGKTFGDLMQPFSAFEESFTGGVFVAAGDFNGDGKADIVITPDNGGGGRTKLIDVSGGSPSTIIDFLGIDDPNFRGGALATLGDVNGDGQIDLMVAAGIGGGPRVAMYDGRTVASGQPQRLLPDFFAFESTLRNGAFLACADMDNDGKDELIFGAGPGGAPRVLFVDSQSLLDIGPQAALANPRASVFAGDPNGRGGARVVAKDFNLDGNVDLLVANATGGNGVILVYKGDGAGNVDLRGSFALPRGTENEGVDLG